MLYNHAKLNSKGIKIVLENILPVKFPQYGIPQPSTI